ncbi:Metal dependent hydrolase [Entamoeba marina]
MSIKTIATHDGYFHLDDVLACVLLSLTNDYIDAKVVRTREKSEINKCDIVVDVGMIYDHAQKRYDHHQKGYSTTWKNSDVPLSGSGLIYLHYGEEVVKKLALVEDITFDDAKEFQYFSNKFYFSFFLPCDADDNGYTFQDQTELYKKVGNLSSRVHVLNYKHLNGDRFESALDLVRNEFYDHFYRLLLSWKPTFMHLINNKCDEYMILGNDELDLAAAVDAAAEMDNVLLVIQKRKTECIARVVETLNGYRFRWPKRWRGLYGDDLVKKAGSGVIFCDKIGNDIVTNSDKSAINALHIALKS